jgi:hypothetical protein
MVFNAWRKKWVKMGATHITRGGSRKYTHSFVEETIWRTYLHMRREE